MTNLQTRRTRLLCTAAAPRVIELMLNDDTTTEVIVCGTQDVVSIDNSGTHTLACGHRRQFFHPAWDDIPECWSPKVGHAVEPRVETVPPEFTLGVMSAILLAGEVMDGGL